MSITRYIIYLLIIAGTTYLIRTIPFVLVKRQIQNPYIKAFLYYIPYSVLAAMTFPAILYSTSNMLGATIGFLIAILFALKGRSLIQVAMVSSLTVFLVDCMMKIFAIISI